MFFRDFYLLFTAICGEVPNEVLACGINTPQLVRNDSRSRLDNSRLLAISHPDTFMLMLPIIFQAGKKMMARYHQHTARL